MENFKGKKLSHKFTFGFILLATLICVSTCTIGYFKYKTTIERQYNDHAYQIAAVAQSYTNGDSIEKYLQTMQTDAEYDELLAKLTNLRQNMDANYIYIAKLDGIDLTYVLDVDNLNDEFDPFQLGDTGAINPQFEEDARTIVTKGERVDNYFYSHSQFGYNTSAIVPVYNSNQEIIGIIGVEISMSLIQSTLREYILYAVVISSLLVFLFIFVFLSYLRKQVISPIKIITENASKFVESNNEFSAEFTQIKTGDEIQTLAESLSKMVEDINSYMDNLAKISAEKERIATELNVATQIQASMLPCIFPAFPDRYEFDVYATMTPAKEVGGDFYDFFLVDYNHLCVVIADVSGKGVPAALFMVIAKTLIKDNVMSGKEPAEVFINVNAQLCENNDAGMFVTAFMAVLEIDTGKFTYVNAGHNAPLIRKANGRFEWLKAKPGFVLAGMEGMNYKQAETTLHKGDIFFMYTDGVTEALNAQNELYGDDRLKNTLNSYKDKNKDKDISVRGVLECVKNDVFSYQSDTEQADDITMLGLKFNGM